jgi:DNA-binding CsgD family transcriptional regulator
MQISQACVDQNLTLAEMRVFQHAMSCKSRKEIARDLNLSLGTVRFHLANIYRKTGCSDRLALIARYYTEEK